jgi:hypothetical protein
MVSYPASSSDRQTNGKPGAGNGHGKAERTPGTPRKDGGARREKAVQVPELKDYVGLRPHGWQILDTYIWVRFLEIHWVKEHLDQFIKL